jgi:GH24 family phage-related lysozyme (muramidase)
MLPKTLLIDLDTNIILELQSLFGLPKTGIIDYNLLQSFANWKRENHLNEVEYIGDYSFELLKKQKSLQPPTQYNLAIVKEFEGFSNKAYLDPLHGWKVPTIGWGTTIYSDGTKVKRGDIITKEKAEAELLSYVNSKIVPTLEKTIPFWNEMNINQKSALISFAYNLGEHFYGKNGFKTISKALKEKNWKDIPNILLLYRNPGTSVEAGLKRRRLAEGKLFSKAT